MHSIYVGARVGIGCPWLSNLVEWSVPGFIVISGWYGIKFSFAKVLKLYGVSLYCALVVVLFDLVVDRQAIFGLVSMQTVWHIATEHWFVNSYAVLMLLAPLVNTAFDAIAEMDAERKKKTLLSICLPVFVLVQIWSFSAALPWVGAFVPHYSGINKNSFVTLLAIYVLTRSIRLVVDDQIISRNLKKIPRRICTIALFGSLAMAATGMGDINGPFAFVIALAMFFVFNRMRLPSAIGKLSAVVAPSVFSIYLFHTNEIAWSHMQTLLRRVLGECDNCFIAYFVVSFVAFAMSFVVDIPIRVVKYLVRSHFWGRQD